MRVWDIHIHDYMHHDGDDDAIKVVDWNSEHSMTSMMNTISLSIDLIKQSIYLSINRSREGGIYLRKHGRRGVVEGDTHGHLRYRGK